MAVNLSRPGKGWRIILFLLLLSLPLRARADDTVYLDSREGVNLYLHHSDIDGYCFMAEDTVMSEEEIAKILDGDDPAAAITVRMNFLLREKKGYTQVAADRITVDYSQVRARGGSEPYQVVFSYNTGAKVISAAASLYVTGKEPETTAEIPEVPPVIADEYEAENSPGSHRTPVQQSQTEANRITQAETESAAETETAAETASEQSETIETESPDSESAGLEIAEDTGRTGRLSGHDEASGWLDSPLFIVAFAGGIFTLVLFGISIFRDIDVLRRNRAEKLIEIRKTMGR